MLPGHILARDAKEQAIGFFNLKCELINSHMNIINDSSGPGQTGKTFLNEYKGSGNRTREAESVSEDNTKVECSSQNQTQTALYKLC